MSLLKTPMFVEEILCSESPFICHIVRQPIFPLGGFLLHGIEGDMTTLLSGVFQLVQDIANPQLKRQRDVLGDVGDRFLSSCEPTDPPF